MNLSIGSLSKQVGCKVPTIRYYEQISLLSEPLRTNGNQRRYLQSHVQQLKFICHARELGFSIENIRQLMAMNSDYESSGTGHLADEIARKHLEKIEQKIIQLSLLREEMKKMLSACESGQDHDCQVMNVLNHHNLCEYEHS